MARTKKTDRINCTKINKSIHVDLSSPRKSKTVVNTPRRVRLIRDAQLTVGKWPRRHLFKAHEVSKATGYRILKLNYARRSQSLHNRGRKSILAHKCDVIEVVENSSFRFRTATHYSNARPLGLAEGSERSIQRNIANYGVGTYMAQQKKFISNTSIKKQMIYRFECRYWKDNDFIRY